MRTPVSAIVSRIRMLWVVALVFAASAGAEAPSEQALNAAKTIANVERALGGFKALRAVRNYVLDGEMEGLSGFPGSYHVKAARPNRRRVDWDIRYISQTRAFDGRRGWERNAAVRELAGSDLLRARRDSAFGPLSAFLDGATDTSARRAVAADGSTLIILRATDTDGMATELSVDPKTDLPVREEREEPFEEGDRRVVLEYADYRHVDGVMMPFQIRETRPDLSFLVKVARYHFNADLAADTFANPEVGRYAAPYDLELKTVPVHVYKEIENVWDETRFWGILYPLLEGWTVSLVVNEKLGRFIEPQSVTAAFYSGERLIKTVEHGADAVKRLARFPVTRFNPQPEIYNLRFDYLEPATFAVDRIVYTFHGRAADGTSVVSTLAVPVSRYRPKHKMIFPIRGNFIAINGHDSDELDHKYEWSQQFAYDIVSLGPQLEFRRPDGGFYGFGRTEVIAPADGTVVYARNDVPDDEVKKDFLKMPDGKWAIGGNIVLIDHGSDEYSLFAHMRHGSVRVKIGDRVSQGDTIGLIGSSGSPGNPHLHYQLQDNAGLFEGDGLPVAFENIRPTGWYEDGPFMTLKRGVYLNAK